METCSGKGPRGKYEICKDILIEAAPMGTIEKDPSVNGTDRYSLLKTGISTQRLDYFLNLLGKTKLIKNRGERLLTTKRGLEYLEKFHVLRSAIETEQGEGFP